MNIEARRQTIGRNMAAVRGITDQKWSMPRALFGRDDDVEMNPRFITKTESFLLQALAVVLSSGALSFAVRQFGGFEGENEFRLRAGLTSAVTAPEASEAAKPADSAVSASPQS